MLFRRVSVNSIIENVRFSFSTVVGLAQLVERLTGEREVEGLIRGVAPTLTV